VGVHLACVREGAAGREQRRKGGGVGGHAAVGEVVQEGQRGGEPPSAGQAAQLGGERAGILGLWAEFRLRRARGGGGAGEMRAGARPPRGVIVRQEGFGRGQEFDR
jgi:hypothetical protein